MPTAPSHHDCPASHSIVSTPSVPSCAWGTNVPGEREVPRTSCATTAYPASTSAKTSGSFGLPNVPASSLPYGVRTSSTGNGPGPSGRHTFVASATPSRIGTGTSTSTTNVIPVPRASRDAAVAG
jgi:hypothetical protein